MPLRALLFVVVAACGSSDPLTLCAGDACVSNADCPATEPTLGDPCDFDDVCHYCDDADPQDDDYQVEARELICDGVEFTTNGSIDCSE